MIYEFRTYTLKPRTLPEFLKRFGEALPPRLALSKLAAFWYTEIGPLNQVLHVWSYENVLERSRIRAEAVKMGIWPPKRTISSRTCARKSLSRCPIRRRSSPPITGPTSKCAAMR